MIKIVYRPLASLVRYAKNSRRHPPEQIAKLRASLTEFGWARPIAIADGTVIYGHGVLQAALELGEQGIAIPRNPDPAKGPTVDLSDLSPTQRRVYVIADNATAQSSEWDDDLLRAELGELTELGFDLGLTGLDAVEIGKLLQGDPDPPSDFQSYDETIQTEHTCPKCGYAWSGGKVTRTRDLDDAA